MHRPTSVNLFRQPLKPTDGNHSSATGAKRSNLANKLEQTLEPKWLIFSKENDVCFVFKFSEPSCFLLLPGAREQAKQITRTFSYFSGSEGTRRRLT